MKENKIIINGNEIIRMKDGIAIIPMEGYKEKTADEMFKELGYYRYDYLDHVDYYNEKLGKFISFRKNGTFVCFGCDNEYKEITMQELQAINKKIQELEG